MAFAEEVRQGKGQREESALPAAPIAQEPQGGAAADAGTAAPLGALKKPFDYAEWRKERFADIDIDPAEFNRKAIERNKANALGAALP